jgi:phosphohistidine phosphatase
VKLLVVRHAIAEDRDEFAATGESDDVRPLTRDGKKKMRRVAKGLRNVVDTIDYLATSPLTRAAETAEIISKTYGIGGAEVTPVLEPYARPEQFEEWCAAHFEKEVVAIVGHEPHLGSLVTWLLMGSNDSRFELKKGGACLIEFESQPGRKSGTCLWLLTPRILRDLAR